MLHSSSFSIIMHREKNHYFTTVKRTLKKKKITTPIHRKTISLKQEDRKKKCNFFYVPCIVTFAAATKKKKKTGAQSVNVKRNHAHASDGTCPCIKVSFADSAGRAYTFVSLYTGSRREYNALRRMHRISAVPALHMYRNAGRAAHECRRTRVECAMCASIPLWNLGFYNIKYYFIFLVI